MNYINRILETNLLKYSGQGKAIVLIGARQVGKTSLLKNLIGKKGNALWINADLPEIRSRFEQPKLEMLKNLIGSYKIVVIDEIQRFENAGLLLKILIDEFPEVQFYATGSSSLEISDKIFEPITGRSFTFHLFPFTLKELYPNNSPFEVEQKLIKHLIYGNYPEVAQKQDVAEMILQNLTDQYLYKDVLVWKDLRKPELLDKLLKLLAFQTCSEVSYHELGKQLNVKSETIANYIDLLEKSFVVYRLNSYATNPRKELSKSSKILFWDNGVRNAIIGDFRDLSMRNDHGILFENFTISERIKMNIWNNNKVKFYFWRNYNKSEVDYIEENHQKLNAYEMKWNTLKKHAITKSFTNMYPNAETKVITPENITEFIF